MRPMDRRGFLHRLGLGAAAAAVTPRALTLDPGSTTASTGPAASIADIATELTRHGQVTINEARAWVALDPLPPDLWHTAVIRDGKWEIID